MRVALCDDEKVQVSLTEQRIRRWGYERGMQVQTELFDSAEGLLISWEPGKYDLLFLDIQMPGTDGMSLARQIRERDRDVGILFVTAYEEYMAQGYEVEAFRYLMKPVREEKLWEALDQFVRRSRKAQPQMVVDTPGGSRRVEAASILCIEAFAHTCELYRKGERISARAGITELEEQGKRLGVPFVRCHRSYSVNLMQVMSIGREEAVLSDGSRIPVSRRMYGGLNQAFIAYYRKCEK